MDNNKRFQRNIDLKIPYNHLNFILCMDYYNVFPVNVKKVMQIIDQYILYPNYFYRCKMYVYINLLLLHYYYE
jgi:hypothetical protein